MLFYSALHYVEAFLVTKSTAYRDHLLRAPEMRRHPETRAIFTQYETLKKAAHEARYEGTPFQPSDVGRFEGCHNIVRDAMVRAVAN
ncbi:MAG: hypothetical protein HYU51_16405 [Candidatus Rokubacteria bacterium]|nr:hypothetical protein [Candidatus Rokubacteria bacterium]